MTGQVHVEAVRRGSARLPELVRLFDDYRVHFGQEKNTQRAAAWLTDHLRNGRLLGYLATVDAQEAAAGVAIVAPSPASLSLGLYWNVRDLFVDPAHRRRGVGRALLDRVRADAVAHGALRLSLQADSGNADALALYRRYGFTRVDDLEQLVLELARGDQEAASSASQRAAAAPK
ncbi:MAG: GNAT family N-acetyltransferase [Actinomycetes bacterium]